MDRYKNLYKWMFIPFLIAQIGIFKYYWPSFASESWEIHIHFWTVTFWYILTIIQPYLITKKKLLTHRNLGMIGFVLAGGVIFSGISLLDIPLKIAESAKPNQPGPPVHFYYAILLSEFFSMLAFALAVVKAIQFRHDVKNHAWWLIASVFFMIVPALGRGMIQLWGAILPPQDFSPVYVFVSTELIYLPLFLLFAHKFGKIKHTATFIGLLLVIIRFLSRPLASKEEVQDFLNAVIVWH